MSRDDRHPDRALDVNEESSGSPGGYVVEPARAASGAGASMALIGGVALVAAAVALAVVGLVSPAPPPLMSPVPPPLASSVPGPGRASAAPDGSAASPVATLPTRDVGSGDAAVETIARLVGWTGCPVWREFGTGAPVSRRDVEAAVRETGIEAGLVPVTAADGRAHLAWLGGEAEDAVRGLGGTLIVRDADTVWTVITENDRSVAVRLEVDVRRDGGTFWQVRGRAEPAPYCVGPVAVSEPVTVVHVAAGGQARLFSEAGWAPCKAWQRSGRTTLPAPDRIDSYAGAAGFGVSDAGWLVIPVDESSGADITRFWLGPSEADAARVHGAGLMVVDEQEPVSAWMRVELAGREIAVQFRILDTPEGRRAWLPTPNSAGVVSGCTTVP